MSAPTIPGFYLHMDFLGQWQLFLVQQAPNGELFTERQYETTNFYSPIKQIIGAWVSRVYGPPKDRLIEDYAVKRNSYGS